MPAYLSTNLAPEGERVECKTIVTIGRDAGCDIVLDDKKASRNHAMLRQLGNGDYYLIDEGSSNGCYVNGKLITAPTLLKDGDRLGVGETVLVFHQEAGSGSGGIENTGEDTVIVAPTGDIRMFTILVADIRGYTTISENTPIKVLTKMMNAWFNRTRECIYEHHGVVDKFIGDCVYARWEVRDDAAGTVVDALGAACELNIISRDLVNTYPEVSNPLNIGVGINTGTAALGADVTESAIGDAVNLAFRLEGLSKEMGKDVIIGRNAYEFLPEGVWRSQQTSMKVKGKTDPVDVWGLKFVEAESILDQVRAISFT
ncbi:MAG: FHA domain-containing protein [Acidiferrobacterales bacterium]